MQAAFAAANVTIITFNAAAAALVSGVSNDNSAG